MKKLLLFFAITMLFSLTMLADPPSPPGGGSTGNSGTQGPPVGAPFDGGLGLLLALGAAYGCKKLSKNREEVTSQEE